MCLLYPAKPGTYHCKVVMENDTVSSKVVEVKNKDNDIPMKKLTKEKSSKEKQEDDKMPSTSGTIPSLDMKELNVVYNEANQIGQGTFGTVYKGKWLGTNVAVKRISVGRRNSMLGVIENEIKILATIRHPNIVQIMGVANEGKNINIISEFIDGHNLEDIIFEDKGDEVGMTERKKPHIAMQAARALAYLHGLCPSIIHQDVKPANFIVQNDTLTTKLCDLGLGRIRQVSAAHTSTKAHDSVGTPSYMAPECFIGKKKGTPQSDMWSLGATMLELFSESDAWKIDGEEDQIAYLSQSLQEQKLPDGLENLKEKCCDSISEMIYQSLDYDPLQRPSAIQFLHHLEKIAGSF